MGWNYMEFLQKAVGRNVEIQKGKSVKVLDSLRCRSWRPWRPWRHSPSLCHQRLFQNPHGQILPNILKTYHTLPKLSRRIRRIVLIMLWETQFVAQFVVPHFIVFFFGKYGYGGYVFVPWIPYPP